MKRRYSGSQSIVSNVRTYVNALNWGIRILCVLTKVLVTLKEDDFAQNCMAQYAADFPSKKKDRDIRVQ